MKCCAPSDRGGQILNFARRSEYPLLTVLLGDGTGRCAEAERSLLGIGRSAWHVSLADFTRDGVIDVAAAAGTDVRILRGNGRGGFATTAGSVIPVGKGAWRLAVADLNADTLPDVVTSNLESHTVAVLLAPPPPR